MKSYIVGLLLLVSCTTPQPEVSKFPNELELSLLRPIKAHGSTILGTLNARLYDESGSLIQKKITSFGDCIECSRGISVKNFLGVRIEGTSLKSLIINRKQSPAVELKDCSNDFIKNGEYNCKFNILQRPYNLKISIE